MSVLQTMRRVEDRKDPHCVIENTKSQMNVNMPILIKKSNQIFVRVIELRRIGEEKIDSTDFTGEIERILMKTRKMRLYLFIA